MSTEHSAQVWVVVLNYNGWRDTVECVESLLANDYPDFHVLVIDNGSTDDSYRELLRLNDPGKVSLVRTGRNLGIAGGNNCGIRHALAAGAEFVVTLSNDTVVAPNLLSTLVETASAEREIGAVGAKILYFSDPAYIWFCGARITPWLARAPHLYAGQLDSPALPAILNADLLMGCVMMLKRAVVDNVGLFDERYFFQNEDLEYSYRMKQAGWRIKVCTRTFVKHKIGRTIAADSYDRWYYATRNRLLFIHERLPRRQRLVANSFFIGTRPAKFAGWLLTGRRDLIAASLEGWRDYRRQRWGRRGAEPAVR